jgi:hypothetical protein
VGGQAMKYLQLSCVGAGAADVKTLTMTLIILMSLTLREEHRLRLGQAVA